MVLHIGYTTFIQQSSPFCYNVGALLALFGKQILKLVHIYPRFNQMNSILVFTLESDELNVFSTLSFPLDFFGPLKLNKFLGAKFCWFEPSKNKLLGVLLFIKEDYLYLSCYKMDLRWKIIYFCPLEDIILCIVFYASLVLLLSMYMFHTNNDVNQNSHQVRNKNSARILTTNRPLTFIASLHLTNVCITHICHFKI